MHLTRLLPRLPRAVAGPAARRATTLSTAIPRASASQTPSSLSPTPAQQPAPTSVKEQLKQSLQRPVQHGTTEDGLRILIFGKPVRPPLIPFFYPLTPRVGLGQGNSLGASRAEIRLAFRVDGGRVEEGDNERYQSGQGGRGDCRVWW